MPSSPTPVSAHSPLSLRSCSFGMVFFSARASRAIFFSRFLWPRGQALKKIRESSYQKKDAGVSLACAARRSPSESRDTARGAPQGAREADEDGEYEEAAVDGPEAGAVTSISPSLAITNTAPSPMITVRELSDTNVAIRRAFRTRGEQARHACRAHDSRSLGQVPGGRYQRSVRVLHLRRRVHPTRAGSRAVAGAQAPSQSTGPEQPASETCRRFRDRRPINRSHFLPIIAELLHFSTCRVPPLFFSGQRACPSRTD